MSPVSASAAAESSSTGLIYACVYCDFEDDVRTHVVQHMEALHARSAQEEVAARREEPTGLNCVVCSVTVATPEALLSHMNYQHGRSKGHRCPWCNQLFKLADELRCHVSDVHQQTLSGNLDYLIVKS